MKAKALLTSLSVIMCSFLLIGCSGASKDPESSSQIMTEMSTTQKPTTQAPTTEKPTERAVADINNPVKTFTPRNADRTEMGGWLSIGYNDPKVTIDHISEAPGYPHAIVGKCSGCRYQKELGAHCCVIYPLLIEGTIDSSDFYGNRKSTKKSKTVFLRSCDGSIETYADSGLDIHFDAGNGTYYIEEK